MGNRGEKERKRISNADGGTFFLPPWLKRTRLRRSKVALLLFGQRIIQGGKGMCGQDSLLVLLCTAKRNWVSVLCSTLTQKLFRFP